MQPIRLLLLAAGVLTLVPRPARAAVPGYKIRTLARAGDTIGDLKIPTGGYFEVGALNDSGQLVVDVQNAVGGEMILQYSGSTFIPIAAGARTVSGVKWPSSPIFYGTIPMNQQGDIAFATQSPTNNTYRWDHQTGLVTPVAAKDMPAANDLTFISGADQSSPALNDLGEVAFQARVKGSAGTTQRGIYLLGRDGKLVPVALPDQTVAGVGTITPDSQATRTRSPTPASSASRRGARATRATGSSSGRTGRSRPWRCPVRTRPAAASSWA